MNKIGNPPRRIVGLLCDPATPARWSDVAECASDAQWSVRAGLAGVVLERTAELSISLPAVLHDSCRAAAMAAAADNVHLMGELETVLTALNRASVPVMLLKGAALNLTLYARPDLRPMTDLDLLVHEQDAARAIDALEQSGCRRGFSLVSPDFFPKFHYELEMLTGGRKPARIDLHVRPFRPLRYARVIPDEALWHDSEAVTAGAATAVVPRPEYMLIHMAAHAAFHGCSRAVWLYDLKRFIERHGRSLDWTLIAQRCREWRLSAAVAQALLGAQEMFGTLLEPEVFEALSSLRSDWRDRLVLAGAPEDARTPLRHVAREVLTTSGIRFRAEYLAAYLRSGSDHLGELYPHRHAGWRLIAHAWRALRAVARLATAPVAAISRIIRLVKRSAPADRHAAPVAVMPSAIHGRGVIVTRSVPAESLIGLFSGAATPHDGTHVVARAGHEGFRDRLELAPPFRFLNHSNHPNARLETSEGAVYALRDIPAGAELTIGYGGPMQYCADCGHEHVQRPKVTGTRTVAVIMTVRNDAGGAAETLRSLACQTRMPQEIIVVDGGSTDDTRAALQRFAERLPALRILDAPGANIARGRNIAIRAAHSELIASTDAGCRAEPDWLAHLIEPFEREHRVEFVAGLYLASGETLLEQVIGLATMRGQLEPVSPETFNPSARSVAFTKELWARAGGWPEWVRFSEDTLFDRKVRSMGAKWRCAERAVVHWRPRSTLRGVAKQFYCYATGRGQTQLDASGYCYNLRNLSITLALVGLAAVEPWAWPPLAAAAAYFYWWTNHERASRVAQRTDRRAAYPLCLAVMAVVTMAGCAGYVVGAYQRWRNPERYGDKLASYMRLPKNVSHEVSRSSVSATTSVSATAGWAAS